MVDYEIVVLDASIFSGINLLLKSPQEEVLGGLVGKDMGNGVWSIEHLWIAEKLQTQGWGTKFLQAFEAIAKAQNKHTILVDTFDYQAPQFYEKNGFECIEVVASHAGYTRHYYAKKI